MKLISIASRIGGNTVVCKIYNNELQEQSYILNLNLSKFENSFVVKHSLSTKKFRVKQMYLE